MPRFTARRATRGQKKATSKRLSDKRRPKSSNSPLVNASPDDTSRVKIRNWSGDADPISDDTLLVRYMKLETFLLLLRRDLVFIPTLQLLQSADRFEGNISIIAGSHDSTMRPIVSPHRKWLLKAAGSPNIISTTKKPSDQFILALAAESWRKELAKRRLIWCWNRSTELLNFMWKSYGDRGVALFSTVGDVRKALADAGGEGIVSPVKYIPWNNSVPRPEWKWLNENCIRPHLFKEAGYMPEREVRFVLKANPDGTRHAKGALVKVSVKTILGEKGRIEVSPHIPETEAINIKDLVFKHRWPKGGLLPNPERERRLWPSSPEAKLPSGLFPDLD
jgi:hypothetical protein